MKVDQRLQGMVVWQVNATNTSAIPIPINQTWSQKIAT